MSFNVGGDVGDIVLGATDSTSPIWRAERLDSQDVQLVASGADDLPPYLSLAAAVWGRRVSEGLNHNLTHDALGFDKYEKHWNEIDNGELTSLSQKGIVTHKPIVTTNGLETVIPQGLNTMQRNGGVIWNEDTQDTWATMQRDLADFVDRVLRTDFNKAGVGADGVTEASVAGTLQRRAEKSLIRAGYIVAFSITSVTLNDAGSGYDIEWNVRLPTTTDYITAVTTILI